MKLLIHIYPSTPKNLKTSQPKKVSVDTQKPLQEKLDLSFHNSTKRLKPAQKFGTYNRFIVSAKLHKSLWVSADAN
ncbi:MAG: hypothetical protein EBX50_19405 [Chitinophagia bacterium]|nr:hypothetical protein [Chitinophagia bacterium]